MTWSYSGNPSESDLDYIRFAIADTDEEQPLLQNEEIETLQKEWSERTSVILACMERILLILSRDCDHTLGPEKVLASQRYKNYLSSYYAMKKKYAIKNVEPQVPVGENSFAIGMMDSKAP